jgi:peptidoglycan/LPS O-acetylase OafA/YrhL
LASTTEPSVRALPAERGRIKSLDGIRGIAVILVLAVHFENLAVAPQTSSLFRWAGYVMSWGWCGVDLFFVLSGFLITGILLDTKNIEKRFQAFYSRRVRRIFPLYYAVVLLCLAVSAFLRYSPSGTTYGPSPIGWATYLLYLQNWWEPFADLHHMRFLGPFWSLAIEEQFYLIWPFCVWHVSTKRLVNICSIGILGSLFLRWWCLLHATSALVVYMNTLTRMDALFVGGFCAVVVRNRVLLERGRKFLWVAVAAVVSGLGLIILRGHVTWNDPDVLVYGHLFFAFGFGCLVLAAVLCDKGGTLFDRTLRARALTVFGKYSYGIYVYQGIVLELTLHVFRHRPWWGHSTPHALALALGWMATPFVMSFASYHLFEKRFLRLRPSSSRDHVIEHLSPLQPFINGKKRTLQPAENRR